MNENVSEEKKSQKIDLSFEFMRLRKVQLSQALVTTSAFFVAMPQFSEGRPTFLEIGMVILGLTVLWGSAIYTRSRLEKLRAQLRLPKYTMYR